MCLDFLSIFLLFPHKKGTTIFLPVSTEAPEGGEDQGLSADGGGIY